MTNTGLCQLDNNPNDFETAYPYILGINADPDGPTVPAVAAQTVDYQPGGMTFAWGASSDALSGLFGYRVELPDTSPTQVFTATGSTSLTLPLGMCSRARVRVVAIDNVGNETPAAEVSAAMRQRGDLNRDGSVDDGDVQLFDQAHEPRFDLSGDGLVNDDDRLALLQLLGETCDVTAQ